MDSLRSPLPGIFLSALLALSLSLPPLAGQVPPPPPGGEERESSLGPISRIVGEGIPLQPGAGLALREGRELRRSARSLREQYPYLVAANERERAAGHGIELRWSNLHLLLEPIPSEAAAVALARMMIGGEVVPDRAAYDRLVDAARRNPMPEGSWEVTVHPRVPERFGLAGERAADGFAVRGTIFTTSGYSALSVVEIHARFPAAGPFTLEQFPAISGPPQSWQTSGDVDEEEQKLLHGAVATFREALLGALRKDLKLDAVAAAYTEGASIATIRHLVGEPLRDIGSGLHRYLYRLGDGRVVVFGAKDEDSPVVNAQLYSGYDPEAGLGEHLEDLKPRGIRVGGPMSE